MRPHNQSTPNPKSTVRIDAKAHMKYRKQPKCRISIKSEVTKFSSCIHYHYTNQEFKPSELLFLSQKLD
jgi:hypothetical protein